jgi:uncharacterized membrane protein
MKRLIVIIISIVLMFWMIKPLLANGYFPMHDDTQVARVVVMGRALRQGQVPVRWVSDLGYGYGYPIYNFYGPLPYYVGGILQAGGVDSVVATKIMFAAGAILAYISFFLFADSIFGSTAALVGSTLFVYAPYHAVQLYIRGSVDEYWAIAFVPFILLGIRYIFLPRKRWIGVLAASLGFFGVICSHTILGYITVGFYILGAIGYAAIVVIRKKLKLPQVLYVILPLVIGLGLSAFFWLPAIVEMGSTSVSSMITSATTGFYDHFVCLGQLWNSPWGYGGSAPGCVDGMSFKLGKFQLIVAVCGIVYWMFALRGKKRTPAIYFVGIAVVLFVLSVIGMLQLSGFIWKIIPFTSFIQYPWRLLAFSMLAMGICGGFVITRIDKPILRYLVAGGLIISCIVINARLFHPQYLYQRDSKAFETPQELRYTISKISDEYLPPGIPKPASVNDIIRVPIEETTTLHVTHMSQTDTYLTVQLVSDVPQSIILKKAYFPGWEYRINGAVVQPSIVHGLPGVIVSEGTSTLEARFINTPVRVLGNIISLLSVVLLGGIIFYDKKTNA